jgi:anaerobic magnesium-protoporphyrin IX monomethyl ester cyclase
VSTVRARRCHISDIILIYPKTGFDLPGVSVDLPMSLLAAASLVAENHSVKIIDQRMDPNWHDTLKSACKSKPLLVGITTMTGPQIHWAIQAAAQVRAVDRTIPIVWGGVHPTLMPRQVLNSLLADYVVIGDGEVALQHVARCLEAGKRPMFGVAYFKAGEYIQAVTQIPVDLNTLPPIPYDLVDVESYIGSQGKYPDSHVRSLIYFSSRGCPYKCAYCCNTALFRSSWRALSPEKVIIQTHELARRYRLDAINFHDEELFVDKNRINAIADGIGADFMWWAQSRMDRIGSMDLARLQRGGLRALQPGIESGSDRILKLINKGETVADMLKTNRRLAYTDIRPLYNFMMGFPTETREELGQSVDLATRLLEENPLAEITGFYSYVPYPGTGLYDLSASMGFRGPNSLKEWAAYNRQHTTNPWVDAKLLKSIMVMSKFIDGRRMIRRLRDNSHFNPVALWLVKQLSRLYRYRWEHHQFDKHLEMRLTEYISNKLFNYR